MVFSLLISKFSSFSGLKEMKREVYNEEENQTKEENFDIKRLNPEKERLKTIK